MDTFADAVLARAGDEEVGVLSDYERLTWGEVVQQAADRAALLSEMRAPGRQVHVGICCACPVTPIPRPRRTRGSSARPPPAYSLSA